MNWLDLIGWAGSALLVWSLLQTRILRLRVFNLVGCLVLIGFNAALHVWPMVGLNVVLAIINTVYIVRMVTSRHDEQAFSVLAVRADDELLDYTLRRHAVDIVTFNPGFVPAVGPGRSAYLVVSGDETVGIVIIAAAGDVARVELDYVTPRFRDFTPGEFVFRRSSLFRGFRQVRTPSGMVGAYYARLGFRPEGDHFALDLEA